MNQIRTIDSIFEKGIGRDYTDDALLYQDILAYSTIIKTSSSENVSFKFTELANWLLRNNTEFLSYYDSSSTRRNTPYNARIHAQRTRIQNKIDYLITLELIKTKGTIKAEKNILETPLYAYTKLGYLLTLIIQSTLLKKQISNEGKPEKVLDKKKDLDGVNNELFCLLDSVFFKVEQNSSSAIMFYSRFIKKCRDKGVFNKLIEHIVDNAHSNFGIKNMRDLFEHVMELRFKEEARRYFLDLWRETIEGFDPEVQNIVLYKLKLSAERRFEDKMNYLSKDYEKHRFMFRADYKSIVLEGNCEKCRQETTKVISYFDYRNKTTLIDRDDPIRLDCEICKTKDSYAIPNF